MSWSTFARNLPLLGGMYVLKLPLAVVAVVSAHFQEPFFCFWMTTGTNEWQAQLARDGHISGDPTVRLEPEPRDRARNGRGRHREVGEARRHPTRRRPGDLVRSSHPLERSRYYVASVGPADVGGDAVEPDRRHLTKQVRAVMTTLVPTLPLVGANDVMVGAGAVETTIRLAMV